MMCHPIPHYETPPWSNGPMVSIMWKLNHGFVWEWLILGGRNDSNILMGQLEVS